VGKLLVLFTVVPLLELYLLILLGNAIGFWPTVGIVLVTGMLGAWLAKREGLRVLHKWQAALAQGRMPEEGVLGGLLVLVGGVFLVTPGVLTDICGLLLLIPPTRRAIANVVRAHFEQKIQQGTVQVVRFQQPGPPPRARDGVIDVEGEVVEVREPSSSARYPRISEEPTR
jgi:UPF0716 protein FxsA